MTYQELLLAIQDENCNLEFLGSRAEMARNEWLDYEDKCEASESYLEELQLKLDSGDYTE